MELLNYTALRRTMTEVCECETALKFSDIIVLIKTGFNEETLHSCISIYKKKKIQEQESVFPLEDGCPSLAPLPSNKA